MISPKNILCLEDDFREADRLLTLFKERIESSQEIIADDGDPEEEKSRILKLVLSHKKRLSEFLVLAKDKTDINAININHSKYFSRLKEIDNILRGVRSMVETIAFEQYESKLDAVKQELFKALDTLAGLFQFIIPNIKNEIKLLTKHYRISSKTHQSIMPELEVLMEQLENKEISLAEFAGGYTSNGTQVRGYDALRVQGGMFSKYQFYENSQSDYGEINFLFQRFLKSAVDFMSKRVTEPDFRKLLDRLEKLPEKITQMSELFEVHTQFNVVYQKMGKKYSFHERYRELTPLLEEINRLKNTLIYYHDESFEEVVLSVEKIFEDEADLKRFEDIIEEVRKQIELKTISFDRLETTFEKLRVKNFNIVLQQKEADDITIEITPHHEKKFGRKNLERVNIIIQEIDFWYPEENKQLLFQDLSIMTRKFQNDDPIDEKKFYTLIKSYDLEMEKNTRIYYPKKIVYLKNVYTLFHNLIMQRSNRNKLSNRLHNPKIWAEVSPRLKVVSKSILVLNSESPSLANNVNKFMFLKIATEELCQLLYDLSMQLFASYRGVDIRSVGSMTNILSIYNEYYDVYSLWSVFNHYFNKNHISNFSINEEIVVRVTKSKHCKARLSSLFPELEKELQETSG